MKKNSSIYSHWERRFAEGKDPWNFESSDYEKHRFEELLRLCKKVKHQRILEIGCAEGHFTRYLTKISKDITAIDVSATAIKRAKQRVSEVKYRVGSIEGLEFKGTFDLIVASEVLYYSADQKQVLNKLRKIGKYLVTSNFLMDQWRAYKSEYYLSSLKSLKRFIRFNLWEGKMTAFGLWVLTRQVS